MSTADERPLFVYGTLRGGERAAHLLADAVLGRAPASTPGRLVAAGRPYPTARFGGADCLEGELVWLDPAARAATLRRLDDYEGAPALFRRVEVRATTADGTTCTALAYEWAGDAIL